MPAFPKNPRLYFRLQFSQIAGRKFYAHNNVVYEGKSLTNLRRAALNKAITLADVDRPLGRPGDVEHYLDIGRLARMRRIMVKMRPESGHGSLGDDMIKRLMEKTSFDRESVLMGRILRRHFPHILDDEVIRVRVMSQSSIESERRRIAVKGAWTRIALIDQMGKNWPAGSPIMLDRKGRMRIASDSLGPIVGRKFVTFKKPSYTAEKQVNPIVLEF